MECIVLAGGFGTRLQSVVADVPKCMAPVNERPFLHYLFNYLEEYNCTKVILSLGYKHEVVLEWLKSQERPFEVDYVIEDEPLGTGGAVQLAMQKATDEDVVILNGDTMFRVDLEQLFQFHQSRKAEVSIALKQLEKFDRYGSVDVGDDMHIASFEEKKYKEIGLINGGIYVINKQALSQKRLPQKFSLEKDYFEAFVGERNMFGLVSDTYFIDIGIPVDYQQAQKDFEGF